MRRPDRICYPFGDPANSAHLDCSGRAPIGGPLLPLAGFLINGIFGRRFSKSLVNVFAIGSVALSFLWVLKTIIGLNAPIMPTAYRVAYHDPCSMQHGQRVTSEPRALLRTAGFRVLDVPEKHFCCGSAGTYNLLEADMAAALGRRKADHIVSTDPDIIATGNIGCMMQLRRYCRIPIVHTVELLDWATGGPRPPALADIVLRQPAPPSASTDPTVAIQTTGGSNDVGIW